MKNNLLQLVMLLGMLIFIPTPSALADSELEGRFQDAFVTAGYSAAAGAAIGAALLSFQHEPTKHLKFISLGASIGFLSGSALGGWMAIAPAFADNHTPKPTQFAEEQRSNKIVLRPWLNSSGSKLIGMEAGAVFAVNF